MKKHQKLFLVALVLSGLITSPATAGVEIVKIDGGGGTITNQSIVLNGDGKYEVSFTAVGDPAITVAVQADTEVIIRWVRVESNKTAQLNTNCNLIVRSKPGTSGRIVRCEEISRTSNDGTANGELWIADVDVAGTSGGSDGNLGVAGTTPGGTISAEVIATLFAHGHVTATVTAGPRLFGGDADITEIEADGKILNDITCSYGAITRIESTGSDIGTSGDHIAVTARDGIDQIAASGSLYAAIACGTSGDLRLLTAGGSMNGSITGQSVQGTDGEIDIAGDLNANITLSASLKVPMTIGG